MSRQVLISLVSHQRMQNVLPLFQTGFAFDEVLLVASAEGREINQTYKSIAQDLIEALQGFVAVHLHEQPVSAVEVDSTKELLNALLASGSDHFTINYTGGTKPMAIGAYLAGVAAGATLLYVDTQTERFLRHRPGAALERIPFALAELSIPMYVRAQGRRIDEVNTERRRFTKSEQGAALMLNALGRQGVDIADRLHRYAQGSGERPAQGVSPAAEVLSEVGQFSGGRLTEAGRAFFGGGRWLETYTFVQMKASDLYDDVMGSVVIGQGSVGNELDAVALANGKLAIIECKHNLRNSARGDDGSQAVLGRIKALRDISAGLFGMGFVVTAQWRQRISARVFERANEFRLQIVTREQLPELAQTIHRALTSRSRR